MVEILEKDWDRQLSKCEGESPVSEGWLSVVLQDAMILTLCKVRKYMDRTMCRRWIWLIPPKV